MYPAIDVLPSGATTWGDEGFPQAVKRAAQALAFGFHESDVVEGIVAERLCWASESREQALDNATLLVKAGALWLRWQEGIKK